MFHPNKKNFALTEILPPVVIEKYGEQGLMLLNPLACITLQQLRNRFGRMRCNSKVHGFEQRALRTVDYYLDNADKTIEGWELKAHKAYANYWGAHKSGSGFDVDFFDTDKDDVIDYILANVDEFPFLTFIEVDINWFHFDTRNQSVLHVWSPEDGIIETIQKTPIDWSKIVDIDGVNFKGLK